MKAVLKTLRQDPVMRQLIRRYGIIAAPSISVNLLADILETVISQQLSLKAANTIWHRLLNLLPNRWQTTDVLSLGDQQLRDAGISGNKTKTIKGICQAVQSGNLSLAELATLDDATLTERLLQLHGIGPWTVEMLLIFALGREDIFSVGDLGLRTAIQRLYGIDRNELQPIQQLSLRWQPYRSYACRYLWKSLDNAS